LETYVYQRTLMKNYQIRRHCWVVGFDVVKENMTATWNTIC